MPATHLSCTRCGNELQLEGVGACPRCFGPLEPVYDVDATKSMLSDYYYACRERGLTPRPVILTMSVCGSMKTLAFLEWLGVHVPRWLANTLRHAPDPLAESYGQCVRNARDLMAFCRRLGLPFGFHVESVSIRKVEIDASVALAAELRQMLDG